MTFHRCLHPCWHRLGMIMAVLFWWQVGVSWFIPTSVFALTGHAVAALLSIGVALFVGTPLVWMFAAWRCRVVWRRSPGHACALPLLAVAWHLRGED